MDRPCSRKLCGSGRRSVQLAEKAPGERVMRVLPNDVLIKLGGLLENALQVKRAGGDEAGGERRGVESLCGVGETN